MKRKWECYLGVKIYFILRYKCRICTLWSGSLQLRRFSKKLFSIFGKDFLVLRRRRRRRFSFCPYNMITPPTEFYYLLHKSKIFSSSESIIFLLYFNESKNGFRIYFIFQLKELSSDLVGGECWRNLPWCI